MTRHESDLTAAEWELIEPLIPRQGRLGRPRERDLREVFNAVQYQLATGCQWRALPNCFPPQGRTLRVSTVQNHFYSWRDTGVFDRMMDPKSPLVALRVASKAIAGRPRTDKTRRVRFGRFRFGSGADGGCHRQPERQDDRPEAPTKPFLYPPRGDPAVLEWWSSWL